MTLNVHFSIYSNNYLHLNVHRKNQIFIGIWKVLNKDSKNNILIFPFINGLQFFLVTRFIFIFFFHFIKILHFDKLKLYFIGNIVIVISI